MDTWIQFAAIAGGFALISFLQWWFSRRRLHSLRGRVESIEKTVHTLNVTNRGMGQRIVALENECKTLKSAQKSLERGDGDYAFSQAQRLIMEGAEDDTVAANSGLSATEIQLMRMLQKPANAHV